MSKTRQQIKKNPKLKRNQIIRKEPVEKKAEELENANKRKLSVLKEAVYKSSR